MSGQWYGLQVRKLFEIVALYFDVMEMLEQDAFGQSVIIGACIIS